MEHATVKKRWWCIREECKHYEHKRKANSCTHPSLLMERIGVRQLLMCPVLTSAEACLGIEREEQDGF